MTSCETTQVPIQCDTESTDPRNVKFITAPSAEFVPEGFQQDTQFGGHAVIDHGNHWLETIETYANLDLGSSTLNSPSPLSAIMPDPVGVLLVPNRVLIGCLTPISSCLSGRRAGLVSTPSTGTRPWPGPLGLPAGSNAPCKRLPRTPMDWTAR